MIVGKRPAQACGQSYETGHPPGFLQILRRFEADCRRRARSLDTFISLQPVLKRREKRIQAPALTREQNGAVGWKHA
jgi:hypothetical protein